MTSAVLINKHKNVETTAAIVPAMIQSSPTMQATPIVRLSTVELERYEKNLDFIRKCGQTLVLLHENPSAFSIFAKELGELREEWKEAELFRARAVERHAINDKIVNSMLGDQEPEGRESLEDAGRSINESINGHFDYGKMESSIGAIYDGLLDAASEGKIKNAEPLEELMAMFDAIDSKITPVRPLSPHIKPADEYLAKAKESRPGIPEIVEAYTDLKVAKLEFDGRPGGQALKARFEESQKEDMTLTILKAKNRAVEIAIGEGLWCLRK
jgi:hypothetical protein